jgi:DNA-directed RNA polymerase specialized sigma24 family protein
MMSAGAYATAIDFQQIFTDDVNSLYLLSLLLTGNHEKADECFVAGIGESTKANHVFKEWAHSWARRTIIQSAIRVIAPRERSATAIRNPFDAAAMDRVPLVLHSEVRAILELAPFERFVFVMSVLERYSDHDCSILE